MILPARTLRSTRVEEADELLMGVFLHASAEDRTVEYVEGREQGSCAVPLVVVGHCPALAGFEGQAGLGTLERLDLVLAPL